MELKIAMMNTVEDLNDYICLTQERSDNDTPLPVKFNMSTILTLKKIRSFEIEYFSKFQKNGIAFLFMERMLRLPPSKTWGILGKEIVLLLRYWLEGLRKYLIIHCPQWWSFLKALLIFINKFRTKDPVISNYLAQELAEYLLDLSTCDFLDNSQRIEVLKCLNLFSAHSNREVRVALHGFYSDYLRKLSRCLASCSHFPLQITILELLLRWLPNRQERAVREGISAEWFPTSLYAQETINMFLERPFSNFHKDARDLLNAHNSANQQIMSVICRKLTVGNTALVSCTDKVVTWLDLNPSHECVSVLLHPWILQKLGVKPVDTHDILVVTRHNTTEAILTREAIEVIISITTVDSPQFVGGQCDSLLDDNRQSLKIWISSKSDFNKVDSALETIFGPKYKQNSIENASTIVISPEKTKKFSSSEDDTRFSQTYDTPKRTRAGFVRPKTWSLRNSPSTTSTTSLAQFHLKVAAHEKLKYEKEPIGICALPNLSCVTEISEPGDDSSVSTYASTRRPACGVKRSVINIVKISESESEGALPIRTVQTKCISPVTAKQTRPISPKELLSATISSYEEYIRNDTLENLKNKNIDDVVNLLAEEAFKKDIAVEKDVLLDSGINLEVKKTPNGGVDNIDGIPGNNSKNRGQVSCTIISKSSSDERINLPTIQDAGKVVQSTTTDESNTDAINDTPVSFVSVRKRKTTQTNKKQSKKQIRNFKNVGQQEILNTVCEEEEIENFFSKHIQSTKEGGVVISPTLARKINESSSESSDSCDVYNAPEDSDYFKVAVAPSFPVDENDIIACLNCIIDGVCDDLDKCAEYLDKEDFIPETGAYENLDSESKENKDPVKKNTRKNKIKITYNRKNLRVAKSKLHETTPQPKIGQETIKETTMSDATKPLAKVTPKLEKRKRKLYSPKDDLKENIVVQISETDDDEVLANVAKKNRALKTKATSYKDLEKDRKKFIRQPRNIRSKSKPSPSISPRSLKYNELFDNLKEQVDNNENIKTVNVKRNNHDFGVYNFTSDSDDDDFKKKTIEVSTKANKKVTKKVNDKEENSKKRKRVVKTPKINQNKSKTQKQIVEPLGDIEDERMRSATPEVLNTSFVMEGEHTKPASKEVEPNIPSKLPLEPIPEVSFIEDVAKTPKNKKDLVLKKKNKTSAKKKTESSIPSKLPLEPTPTVSLIEDNVTTPKNKIERVVKKKKETPEAEPNIPAEAPLQPIPEISLIEDNPKTPINKKERVVKKRKEKVTVKKEKDSNIESEIITVPDAIERVESPLPALVIESEPKIYNVDDGSIISSNNILKMCKRVLRDGDAVDDTTQNLLSDIDNINYSPNNVDFPNENEINKILEISEEIETINKPVKQPKKYIYQQGKQIDKNEEVSKANKIKVQKESSIIEISSNNELLGSEKSIETVGKSPITAHGENCEEPPNTEMLQNILSPRNLELINLSSSMKDFFLNMRAAMETDEVDETTLAQIRSKTGNELPKSSGKSKRTCEATKSSSSPTMSLGKLLVEKKGITARSHKNLPANNVQSEVSNSSDKSKKSPEVKKGLLSPTVSLKRPPLERKASKKHTKSETKTSETRNTLAVTKPLLSPTVSLKHLTYDDMKRWLPSPTSFLPRKSPDTEVEEIADEPNEVSSPQESVQTPPASNKKRRKYEMKKPKDGKLKITIVEYEKPGKFTKKTSTSSDEPKKDEEQHQKRKSIISPIIMDVDCMEMDVDAIENDAEVTERDEESKEVMLSQASKVSSHIAPYSLRSIHKDLSTSTNATITKVVKKRKNSPPRVAEKRGKFEEDKNAEVLPLRSQHSVESVKEWFKRDVASSSRDGDIHASCKECVESVLEKIDTTLIEIQHNTSRKLLEMLVGMREEQQRRREERAQLYRSTHEEIEAHWTSIADKINGLIRQGTTFASERLETVDERCSSLDREELAGVKQRAAALLRADCLQKKALVQILHEDVQAVRDHMDKQPPA